MAEEEFNGAILFCPVCCSTVDATAADQTEFECASCGQTWTLEINLTRIAEFSIH